MMFPDYHFDIGFLIYQSSSLKKQKKIFFKEKCDQNAENLTARSPLAGRHSPYPHPTLSGSKAAMGEDNHKTEMLIIYLTL